jgi:hypothetical protein
VRIHEYNLTYLYQIADEFLSYAASCAMTLFTKQQQQQ